MKTVRYSSIVALSLFFTFPSCDKDEPGASDDEEFNRRNMLSAYADEIIIPAYEQASIEFTHLKTAADDFVADPNESNLIQLQTSWRSSVINWQDACAFNFGPASEQGVRKSLVEEIATFPINVSKIEDRLDGIDYNLNDFSRDARGLFAIEFLIFSKSLSQQELVDRYDNDIIKNYLTSLCENVLSRVKEVESAWAEYRTEFISNSGTDVGSSTSMLYNEFVKSYESAKNFKLGLPLGLRPGQTGPEPELLEARFSGLSHQIIKRHFDAMVGIWNARSENGGFKSYLKSVAGGDELISTTESQIEVIRQKIEAVASESALVDEIETNPQPWIDIHTELQKNTKNFKSDLSSLIGIAITFSSGDGD